MKLSYDPSKIAEYEIKWWIAHNAKDKENLKKYLALQNMTLYGVDEDTVSKMVVFLFTAVKFHDTRDWDSAVQQMSRFYELVKMQRCLDFDTQQVAMLEVEWWKLHDSLEHNPDKTELAVVFSKLFGAIFSFPSDGFMEGCKERAAATYEHDLAEDAGTPPNIVDFHWKMAEQHLVSFYTALKEMVK